MSPDRCAAWAWCFRAFWKSISILGVVVGMVIVAFYAILGGMKGITYTQVAQFTVPEFIGDRYYSGTARLVAALCAIVVSFTYVAGQMNGVGIAFSRFLR